MRLYRRRLQEEAMCSCGHTNTMHMGLYGQCLAPLGNGSDVERRLSDLCCEVGGGCSRFADERNPTAGLWDKRNTPSGYFETVKRNGNVTKGVKREN